MPLFLVVFHIVLDYCAVFFSYITDRKSNNELGLPHQDGGNIFSHKTIEGDRENPTLIEIHALLSI